MNFYSYKSCALFVGLTLLWSSGERQECKLRWKLIPVEMFFPPFSKTQSCPLSDHALCIFILGISIWLPGVLLSQLAPLTFYSHS